MTHFNMTMSREFLGDLMKLPSAVYPRALRTAERMLDNPWAPELHPEKIHRADRGMHSCQVDDAYRIIWKHIKPDDIVFCLVDHHDEAYRRASRKQFTLKDDVVQIADIVELGAQPIETGIELFAQGKSGQGSFGALFVGYLDRELLEMGVPAEALPNIRALDDVNQLEQVERLLPADVYDGLLARALDIVERPIVPDSQLRESLQRFQGGDDLYRFLDSDEFKRALEGTMEDWMLFLAPPQRRLVNRTFNGPARVKGVAGSGKTVVAIHRARYLAHQATAQGGRVLFLTYGNRLPQVVSHLLEQLAGQQAPELAAIECTTIHKWCFGYLREYGVVLKANKDAIGDALNQAIGLVRSHQETLNLWTRQSQFFTDEIRYGIKGRRVRSLNEYLALDRSGRGTPLNERQRRAVFAVYQHYQETLARQGLCDFDDFALRALDVIESGRAHPTYVAAVVDEMQDLTEVGMRLIRRLVAPGGNDLFLVGDGLQRIYPGGYALGQLGIDITGRSTVLRRNYRNTQEILRAAHAMVEGGRFDDLDEADSQVIEPEYSMRRGDLPVLRQFSTPDYELAWVQQTMEQLQRAHGYRHRDFALLYRWRKPYVELIQKYFGRKMPVVEIDQNAASYFGPGLKHTTFHSAKGLEFKVVFVVGATDGSLVPRDDWSLQDEELKDYLARERRLLYVAMTRARDQLYLTCSRGQPSRFLRDVPQAYLSRK